ncbi:putative secreted protein [Ixodes scapularis]
MEEAMKRVFSLQTAFREVFIMSKMIGLLVVALAYFYNLAAGQSLEGPRSCDRELEVWNPKCNAHCEPTCQEGDLVPCSRSGGGPRQGFNERICRPKCNCKPGYIRETRDGRCVHRSKCGGQKDKCKRNEVFDHCGSACPAVCGEAPGRVCTAQCVPGCFCDKGFIRDKKGLCIPLSACRNGPGQGQLLVPLHVAPGPILLPPRPLF